MAENFRVGAAREDWCGADETGDPVKGRIAQRWLRIVSGRCWPEKSAVSNLRPLVVRWLDNIRLTTRSSCVPVWAARRHSTTAAAVSPGGSTAAAFVASPRGLRACGGRRASTTTAIPTRGRRHIGSRKQSGALAMLSVPWGITAATKKRESYEYVPRRRLMPSWRSSMPLPSALYHRHLSKRSSHSSPGSWLRGPRCSRPPVDGRAPRRAASFVDGKDASSRSFPWSSGGTVGAGLVGRRDVCG